MTAFSISLTVSGMVTRLSSCAAPQERFDVFGGYQGRRANLHPIETPFIDQTIDGRASDPQKRHHLVHFVSFAFPCMSSQILGCPRGAGEARVSLPALDIQLGVRYYIRCVFVYTQ